MLPNAQPKDPAKRRLKVKMTIYMITTALSQYNNGGDPEMKTWTSKQPERVYQMLVEPEDIGAYLRVRGGLSKAGRGVYARRRPFVLMRFYGVDAALAVMNKEVGFIDGVAQGLRAHRGLARVRGQPQRLHDARAGAAHGLNGEAARPEESSSSRLRPWPTRTSPCSKDRCRADSPRAPRTTATPPA